MPTLATANTYFEAAKQRERMGDSRTAIEFYKKAAIDYAESLKNIRDSQTKAFIEQRIEECKQNIEKYVPKQTISLSEADSEPARNAASFEIKTPTITFDDVAGMRETKEALERAIIYPLKYNVLYEKFVKEKSFGIFLYGPPGCGKTYITESAVGEANKEGAKVSFIKIAPKDILDKYVGNSEKNIDAAFKAAIEHAPSVLFFDEIDGLGMMRRATSTYSDRLVNQFLTCFEDVKDKNVVVVGATNFPWNVDPALIRPGRLGTHIFVSVPDLEARIELFRIHLKDRPVDSIDYDVLGKVTDGFTSADIKQICEQAALSAFDRARKDPSTKISMADFESAIASSKPSIYTWINQAAKMLKRQEFVKEFGELVSIIRKYTSNGANLQKPQDQSFDGSEDGEDYL